MTNLGSYNYLGFSANGAAAKMSIDAIDEYGVSTGRFWRAFQIKPTSSGGISSFSLHSNHLHRKLEKKMARFLNVDDAVVFPMVSNHETIDTAKLKSILLSCHQSAGIRHKHDGRPLTSRRRMPCAQR